LKYKEKGRAIIFENTMTSNWKKQKNIENNIANAWYE
jgi:hypothetical protein